MKPISNPLEYVSELPPRRHIALFYEDEAYAKMIEFWYILSGLQKEECCIYTTHGNPKIVEKEMREGGIDVETFKHRDLLHICKIRDPAFDPKGMPHGVRQIMTTLFKGNCRPPFRIVSRFVRRTLTKREIMANIRIDSNVQAAIKHKKSPCPAYALIENLDGSFICPYPLDVLTPEHREWIMCHLRNHDAAIFAPKNGAGFVLTSAYEHDCVK